MLFCVVCVCFCLRNWAGLVLPWSLSPAISVVRAYGRRCLFILRRAAVCPGVEMPLFHSVDKKCSPVTTTIRYKLSRFPLEGRDRQGPGSWK